MLRDFRTVGLLLLLASSAAVAGSIQGLHNTGSVGWSVFFGNCPLGANNCIPGDLYLGQAAEVPIDADLVQPNVGQFAPNYPYWYTGPLRTVDDSVWIAPSVRAIDSPDGPGMVNTIRYLPPDPGGPMDFGTGVFEYQTTFALDGFNPDTAWIEVVWLADGMLRNGCGIQLNGTCFDNGFAAYQYYSSTGFTALLEDGFLPGENTLSFFVLNGYRETGLRASFDSFAEPIPEPSTWLLIAGGLGLAAWQRRRG